MPDPIMWIQNDIDLPDQWIVCDDCEVLFGPSVSRTECECFLAGFLHGMRYAHSISGNSIELAEAIDSLEAS